MAHHPEPKDSRRRRLMLASLGVLGAAGVRAQDGAARNRALYLQRGDEREARLLEGAGREKPVNLYTSLNTKDAAPLTEAFEKKTGIKVVVWRASSEKVLQRAVTEARAGRHAVDVLETNSPEMEAMYREKLLAEFFSPQFRDLAPAAFPKHRHYVADRFSFFVVGYNTDLVRPDQVPASYQDLLHPRFAGRIGIEAGDIDWFGAMVKFMGEDKGLAYFARLADSRPQIRSGHSLLGELLASGEVPITATIHNHNIERLARQGAPVQWKALAPTFGRPNAIALAARAANPHAALLFADFVLSTQGQTILRERNRVPASLAVPTPLNRFAYEMIDPVITLDEFEKWEGLWSRLFLKGQKPKRDEA